MPNVRVAVDVMGGDEAPAAQLEGARRAAAAGIPILLVGDPDGMPDPAAARSIGPWWIAREVVAMDGGAEACRRTPDASIRRCMVAVREGQATSVVSAGNSGATMVSAVIDLGMLPGVDRPAIVVTLPRADGGVVFLLDAGATVECRPDHLAQFATLGGAWARAMGVAQPRVGLLSNGVELHKGTRLVRETDALLRGSPGYVGQVEPHVALFTGVDVLVADGFSGNVMLKTAEGIVALLKETFLRELSHAPEAAAAAPALAGVFEALRLRVDWRARGGALLVGAAAPVVIAHGRADAAAVDAAIRLAHYASEVGLVDDVRDAVAGARLREASAGPSGVAP